MANLIAARVKSSKWPITAKRQLPVAVAEGYEGSPRNFRRAVAAAKAAYRRDQGRLFRPWQPSSSGPLA